jgi:asparagine synthase (glutamine-hydrolysing)
MCGIAGLARSDGPPVDRQLLARMTDVLAHRGPDGRGLHVEASVGLGHRRLAIIDLTTGAQPMGSEDGAIWITYNGEVYNYRELRQELASLGHRFRTTSDTEVVLHAYEAWGPDCVPRLRGMFAFAIWDGRDRSLLLARDRLGIKPMVYAWNGATLRFASEIKALLEDAEVPRDLDWCAIRDYFTFLVVPGPRSVFRAIRKLPPASYLRWRLDVGPPVLSRYWTLTMTPENAVPEGEWIERLDDALADAVGRHLVSDVPVGAFLSGGLDSSAVVAYMVRTSRVPVKTFSVGFDDAAFDELRYARLVARRLGTEHFETIVKPDVVAILPRLARQLDEPFADASAIPTYCVSQMTREHVTVALSGDGGDESFGGYRRYAEALRLDRQARALRPGFAPAARRLAAWLPRGMRGQGFLELLTTPPLLRYFRLLTYQRDDTLAQLLGPAVMTEVAAQTEPAALLDRAATSGTDDYLSLLQYLDFHHYLPEDILTKVDRMSMLASLETRVPLLDHVLVELVARIPSRLKVRNGVSKHILKRTLAGRLPPETLSRRKMGFGVPLAGWFRGELRTFLADVLTDRRARQRGFVQPHAVDSLLQAHQTGRRDQSPQLWSLLCFELWCRTWLDR